ncbi:MAG TPA: hypothetical protein VF268_03695 [Gammaproteobacteria bacterium]
MLITVRFFAFLILSVFAFTAFADWHTGTVRHLAVGYDGVTVTFKLDGWVRSDCTCYGPWPSLMCLNSAREAHDFEKALLLAARARGSVIRANIDESTCQVKAIYEAD